MHNINNTDLYSNSDILNDNYLIKIEMVDGSFQYIQITKEQAVALGIEFGDAHVENEDIKQEIHDPDQDLINVETLHKNNDSKTKYNYKIIQPEDLNLRPMPLSLPRGRPKKRPAEEPIEEKQITPPKVVKPSRTRSGRITRPPIHMEKHFEKIITEEDKSGNTLNKEVSTTKFEPLTTNDIHIKSEPESVTEKCEKKKKRMIPSQYRCTTCHKAYLGRNRMSQHLRKHPDHGIGSQLSLEDCDVWSCLVETSLKVKEGQKGTKFCKEIVNLIKNARTLVKYFFKPARIGREEYYVDAILSSILNIKEGHYRFNENELCKDISIFSFLEYFDDNFAEHILKLDVNKQAPQPAKTIDAPSENLEISPAIHFGTDIMDVIKENSSKECINQENYLTIDKKPSILENKVELMIPQEENLITNKTKNNFALFECPDLYLEKTQHKENYAIEKSKSKPDYLFESKQSGNDKKGPNDFTNLFDVPNFFNHNKQKSNVNNIYELKSDSQVHEKNKDDFNTLFNCHEMFDSKKDDNKTNDKYAIFDCGFDKTELKKVPKSDDYNLDIINALQKDKQGKELDIYRNIIPNILSIGASDEHMISILSQKNGKMKNDNIHFDQIIVDQKKDAKKDEFDIHKLNLLSDISDELILPDAGPVTHLLDTSTNSDDIMNVDQFVNERFKKLTESDSVDITNATLSLDLPTLDCFNFTNS